MTLSGLTLGACSESAKLNGATTALTTAQKTRSETSSARAIAHASATDSTEKDAPKPTHRTVTGPGYSLRLPIHGWSVDAEPTEQSFPKNAIVGLTNDLGCQGAIIVTDRKDGESLETAKKRVVEELKLKEVQTIFENRLLYNSTTAFQYNVRGEYETRDDELRVRRVQGTILRDHRRFVEVRAWSSRSFEMARACHDAVTASFTNLGLGKLHEPKKGVTTK